jgi:hypothetical protein
MKGDIDDPKALIREGYNIAGITYGECRTIFLAWSLGVPADENTLTVIARLLIQYGAAYPDHPMTHVLKEGLEASPAPVRRGGWRGRRNH